MSRTSGNGVDTGVQNVMGILLDNEAHSIGVRRVCAISQDTNTEMAVDQ